MASLSSEPILSQHLDAAQTLWDYLQLGHTLDKSDVILALGSNYIRTAEVAADLYLEGMASWLVMSGNHGYLTTEWSHTEADEFCEAAVKKGVPREEILLEEKATNTGENIIFTHSLLKDIEVKRIILVTRPGFERRSWSTFLKQWGDKVSPDLVRVTSDPVKFREHLCYYTSHKQLIGMLVGEIERFSVYATKGFIVPQQIPPNVLSAYNLLRETGLYEDRVI